MWIAIHGEKTWTRTHSNRGKLTWIRQPGHRKITTWLEDAGGTKLLILLWLGGSNRWLNLWVGILSCSYKAILFLGGALGPPLPAASLTCNLGNIGPIEVIWSSCSFPLFIFSNPTTSQPNSIRKSFHSNRTHRNIPWNRKPNTQSRQKVNYTRPLEQTRGDKFKISLVLEGLPEEITLNPPNSRPNSAPQKFRIKTHIQRRNSSWSRRWKMLLLPRTKVRLLPVESCEIGRWRDHGTGGEHIRARKIKRR